MLNIKTSVSQDDKAVEQFSSVKSVRIEKDSSEDLEIAAINQKCWFCGQQT